MPDLREILSNVPQAVDLPIHRQIILGRCNLQVERHPQGFYLHFDLILAGGVERYTLQFERDGLERMVSIVQGELSGIQIAPKMPKDGA